MSSFNSKLPFLTIPCKFDNKYCKLVNFGSSHDLLPIIDR